MKKRDINIIIEILRLIAAALAGIAGSASC